MIRKIILLVISIIFAANTAFASVTDTVKKTVDSVVQIVADPEMKKKSNETKRRSSIKTAISSIFDSQEMSKRTLTRHWRDRTPAEQKQFTELFADLLENSYVSKIESYNDEKIVYTKETIDGNYAEVKSKVVTARNDEYTLDYRLHKQGNKWMVYDVVIEGVSLVSNYRTQFNKIINSEGYGGLVKKLQAKNDELKL
jgi:phospholipid transport system substrate-binding protein